MNSTGINSCLVVLAVVFLSLSARPCGLAQILIRELSCYENGGSIDINPIEGKTALQGVARLRSFIWKHWIEQRRGVITTIVHPVDYASSKVSYFIEPSPCGVWQLVIESQRKSSAGWSGVIERTVASDVKRIEIASDGWSKRVEISKKASRKPSSYHLLLKDERGGVIEEF